MVGYFVEMFTNQKIFCRMSPIDIRLFYNNFMHILQYFENFTPQFRFLAIFQWQK